MRIFLDVDGVLADWVDGVRLAAGIEPSTWDTVGHGLLPTQNQAKIDAAMSTREFWVGLVRYPWADELFQTCQRHGEVIFCTQPFDSPECLAGKYQWLSNHFGATMDNIVFTRKKWRLANPQSLLIDDNKENCDRFQYAGGHSILFPQPWNTADLILSDSGTRQDVLDRIYDSVDNVERITKWFE